MITSDTGEDKRSTYDPLAAEATVVIKRPPPRTAPLWPPLPDELADDIFGMIFNDPGPIAIWRARIQQCCRRWYWYIEESPRYWTRITDIPPPETWAKHLAKSQSQSLQVSCTCPDRTEQPFMLDLVKDVLERVEQLHCSVDNNSDVPRPTEDFLTQPETVEVIAAVPAPSLQELHFHSNRYRPWIIGSLFDGIAPNLRNVQFSYVSIPWRLLCRAQRLETVIIDCAPHLPSPFEILYIFEHCPNLLKFHIHKNDAASFVVISEPVWYEPLQIPCPQTLASDSLQSFVAAELPVPGLHYILEHLTFPQSASIDISVKQAFANQTPLSIASLIILSDVISVTDDSHIELWITGQTVEVRDQDIKVRFHNAITASNYHEVLLAIPSNMRNGVARVVFHSQLNLQEARELLAAVTFLFPSISQMECWCEASWADLLTDVGNQLPQLQRFTLIFKCNGSGVPEVSQTSQGPLTSENLCQENLKAFRVVRSRLPRMMVEGYEMKHGDQAPS